MSSSASNADTALEGAREQIVKAARACFLRFGTEKTSMSDVAREAGLSRGTVYRYFDDRADLIEGVFAYESQHGPEPLRPLIDIVPSYRSSSGT